MLILNFHILIFLDLWIKNSTEFRKISKKANERLPAGPQSPLLEGPQGSSNPPWVPRTPPEWNQARNRNLEKGKSMCRFAPPARFSGADFANSKAASEITQRGEPRLTSDLHRRSRKNRLPKIHQKKLVSHFPIFLYIFPKVDFDGKSRGVESPMSINEGLAGLHGSREYSQSIPRAISV